MGEREVGGEEIIPEMLFLVLLLELVSSLLHLLLDWTGGRLLRAPHGAGLREGPAAAAAGGGKGGAADALPHRAGNSAPWKCQPQIRFFRS